MAFTSEIPTDLTTGWSLANSAAVSGTTAFDLTAASALAITLAGWDLDTFIWKNDPHTGWNTSAYIFETRAGSAGGTANYRIYQDSSSQTWRWYVAGVEQGRYTRAQCEASPYCRLRLTSGTIYFEIDSDATFASPEAPSTGVMSIAVGSNVTAALYPRFHNTGGSTTWFVRDINLTAAPTPTQVLRPSADLAVTGWTTQAGGTTNLYTTLDETTADDADYIKAVTP